MLAPGKKSYEKPRQPTEVHLVKAMVFPVVIMDVRVESWTVKKAECQRIDAFELWCWRRLFRVPWTPKRSNQSILKEISPEYSLEGLMLKLQYFGHWMWRSTIWKRPWCWERFKAEERGDRRLEDWIASQTSWTWVWAISGRVWVTGNPSLLQSTGSQRVGHNLEIIQPRLTSRLRGSWVVWQPDSALELFNTSWFYLVRYLLRLTHSRSIHWALIWYWLWCLLDCMAS